MPATPPLRASAALALCAALSACALFQPAPVEAPLGPGEVLSVDRAREAVVLGRSTKTEVNAVLGKPVLIDFGGGHEIWVYREKPPQQPRAGVPGPRIVPNAERAELVVLFAPDGVASKARVRRPGANAQN